MHEAEAGSIEVLLAEIRAQLADLSARVSRLEGRGRGDRGETIPAAIEAREAAAPAAEAPAHPVLSEERLVAISAAVAAFLGERVRIRQIRLIRSNIWAQQGRVSVQASHWVHR